ncbi:16S rRNA (uracil(1498)-N(3))-methyltransferase [Eubacterium sp.]|uniref:16S rRNA (uracil(1498)-N(3))-methyltransferase n=2 Tax=Eubacterium TaxID=1730 RepID=UPI0025F46404|nr:16S rRNA (uracil(1498)-N(3))-methyltransferase [Eubacterium sp.]MCR5628050.1 16S rRNA (uracil(1498)-N(3))-methyltransferase [Eubacterium sp.]
MHRFFVDSKNVSDEEVRITGSDVNHIKNVLRMKQGDKFYVSDGDITDVTCEITEINSDEVIAKIIEEHENTELASRIVLFQGLPKSDKMELIVQKATELGASQIVPVAMKRCVVKLDEKKAANKKKRYEAIALSAAKQSKRSVIPEIGDVVSFKDALNMAKDLDVCLVPYESAKGMEGTREVLAELEYGQSIGIFIGPEGGFDDKEIEEVKECGFNIISLGRRILRTETAGLTTLSILMYLLEE